MSEYDNWEHGDYTVVITPDNVDLIAESIEEDSPNFPLSVFYDFAETVYGKEMRFSEFMDQLHAALQDKIDEVVLWMAQEGNCEMFCSEDGSIVFGSSDFIEDDLNESETDNVE